MLTNLLIEKIKVGWGEVFRRYFLRIYTNVQIKFFVDYGQTCLVQKIEEKVDRHEM